MEMNTTQKELLAADARLAARLSLTAREEYNGARAAYQAKILDLSRDMPEFHTMLEADVRRMAAKRKAQSAAGRYLRAI